METTEAISNETLEELYHYICNQPIINEVIDKGLGRIMREGDIPDKITIFLVGMDQVDKITDDIPNQWFYDNVVYTLLPMKALNVTDVMHRLQPLVDYAYDKLLGEDK